MSESFQLGGDPASIRASARQWAAFAAAAGSAASGIRSLDTSEFSGDEAETYRDRITADLPKHLDTASTAWGVVAAALTTYASDLERHQQTMGTLATRAGNQQSTVDSYRTAVQHSRQSDQSHSLSLIRTRQQLEPGESMPSDSYVSSTAANQRQLDTANAALQATYDAASTVRSENAESVRRCRAEIDRAKHMRFAKPPGFWGRLKNSVCDWIADHADVLQQISSVLKTISGIAGLLALIPIPVVQEVMAGIALATGGAALLIDVGVKLATGKGSWTQIGLDALSMVPGARAAKVAFVATTAYTGYNVATGKASVADLVMTVGLGALGMKGHGGKGPSSEHGFEPPAGGRSAGGSHDPIQAKLQNLTNTAHADFTAGKIKLTPRQSARVRIRRAQGKTNDMFNTFKGDRIDRAVKKEVDRLAKAGDPDLSRVTSTGPGKKGPDFINNSRKPGEADWYDVTTRKSWQAHVDRYSPTTPTPSRPHYGAGVGIFWS